MSTVKILTRVTAAGVTSDDKIRLSITLIPERSDEAGAFSLANWPTRVRNHFKDRAFALVVQRPVAVAEVNSPTISADVWKGLGQPPSGSHAVQFLPALQTFAAEDVETYWAELVQKALRQADPWTSLADACAAVTNASSKPYYKNNVPNVVGTGRGDAALQHLYESAKRMATRVLDKSNTPSHPLGEDVALASATKTWSDDKLDIKQKTAEGDAQKLFKDALKKETDALQQSVDSLSSTQEARTSFPVGRVFDDRPVAGSSQKPSDQVKTLHRAAQLEDAKTTRPPGALPKDTVERLAADESGMLPVDADADLLARSFLAAIRTSPMLARLFLFVVDVELPLSALAADFIPSPEVDGDAFAYFLIGAGEVKDDKVDASKLLLTVTKATRTNHPTNPKLRGFWPATREELDLRLATMPLSMEQIRATGTVSQVDGVVDLGQRTGNVGSPDYNPRFDIVSIDPILAVEAAIRNDNKHRAVAQSLKRLDLTKEKTKAAFLEIEPGIVSRGLAIVDRRRAGAVREEIETAAKVRDTAVTLRVLDADDLTIGYRVDVALRTSSGETQWRSLMEREVDYFRVDGKGKQRNNIEAWFAQLGLKRGANRKKAGQHGTTDRRRDFDAATILPASRRRLIEGGGEMVHAEEMIAVWEGDPLGIHCGKDSVIVRDGSDVAITRHFDLPKTADEDDHKCWPLRYGYAYRFGIRPVWLGGVSLPLDDAKLRYESAVKGYADLALPGRPPNAPDAAPWRRFLRFERILPPIVLLPDGVADEKTNFTPQSALRAILRTLGHDSLGKKYADREHDSTWRIILPPRLSLDEAMRHGVFDNETETGKTPAGGFLAIDYDAPTCERAKGSFDPAQPDMGQKFSFPTMPKSTPSKTGEGRSSEDRFRVHPAPVSAQSRGDAAHQYYIDPMTDRLVVAIRRNGDTPGVGYFEGTPRVFDLVVARNGHVRPVAIRIVRDLTSKQREKEPTQKDFWSGDSKLRRISGHSPDDTARRGTIEAHVATIRLQPGDSVDIDCWFLPTLDRLKAVSGWPETLALLASRADPAAMPRTGLPEQLHDALAKRQTNAAGNRNPPQAPWIGMAGLTVDPSTVTAAAGWLYDRMLKFPVSEISAVRSIDAVHAVARPPRPPAFADTFAVLRCPSDDEGRRKRLESCQAEGWLKEPARLAVERLGKRGEEGVVFAGKVMVDRDTCRQIEVRAWCVSPARTVLDDVKLGRTPLQRLLGEWPTRLIPGLEDDTSQASNKKLVRSRSARHLFGFDVDEEGRVRLPVQPITLMQLDDLEQRGSEQKFAGNDSVDLVAQQISTLLRRQSAKVSPTNMPLVGGATRATPLDLYSSRLARKIVVVLRGTTRFDSYFTRLTPAPEAPLPEIAFPPDPEFAEFVTRQSCEGDPLNLPPWGSEARTLWIPATIAPAKPAVHAVLPSYLIDSSSTPKTVTKKGMPHRYWQYRRKSALRVMLERPWYSSGEGERLGVVLWPPLLRKIAAQDAQQFDKGNIPRSVLHGVEEADADSRTMTMGDFDDDDLGVGGKFTTRWGADPIRQNNGPLGPFVPPAALVDFEAVSERADAGSPVYVPRIEIPLKDLREENSTESEGQARFDELTAALLAYEPRFDVETEKWFVDVTVHADRLYEPFMRLGLVRYQPEAVKELRVSAPVVSWGQVLPWRQVEVWSRRDGDAIVIEVQVNGPVSGRSGPDGSLVFPRMRISVIGRDMSAAGTADERLVEAAITTGETKEVIGPADTWATRGGPSKEGSWASERPWSAKFRIQTAPGGGQRQFSVLIEELEDFSSTANERGQIAKDTIATVPSLQTSGDVERSEIISPDDPPPEGIERSGPRFLARLDIEA